MANEKHYVNDEAKSRAREMQYQFYANNLTTDPNRMKVWCFPGIDGAELPIYERLGIPFSNIVGFEREPGIADTLKRQYPGLQIEGSIEDYLAKQSEIKVHLLSVDYTQQFGPTELLFLRDFGFKNRNDSCLVHVANLAKREGQSQKNAFHVGHYFNRTNEISSLPIHKVTGLLGKTLTEVSDECTVLNQNLGDFRNDTYTGSVIAPFDAINVTRVQEFFNRYPIISDRIMSDFGSKIESLEQLTLMPGFPLLVSAIVNDYYIMRFNLGPGLYTGEDMFRGVYSLLANHLIGPKRGPLLPIAHERYKYISESGSPMYGELLQLDRNRPTMLLLDKLSVESDRRYVNMKNIRDLVNSVAESNEEFPLVDGYPDRIDLGSAAKPRLTMKRAKQLAQDGAFFGDILTQYSVGKNFSPQRFAALKAHSSMGTYDEKKVDYSLQERKAIIDLIVDARKKGTPELEVATSLEIPMTQFRAFKAIATRMQNSTLSD